MVMGANPYEWARSSHCLTEATRSGVGATIGLSCAAVLAAGASWCVDAWFEGTAS
jgi:hypothetical protein